jgi:hypothetical protein
MTSFIFSSVIPFLSLDKYQLEESFKLAYDIFIS